MTVFDASALLAFLNAEVGADTVESALRSDVGRCGAANWSEVAQKVRQGGGNWSVAAPLLLSFGLTIEPVTSNDGEAAAAMWRSGSPLSLGDRLCLALAQRVGERALTADSAWEGIPNAVLVR